MNWNRIACFAICCLIAMLLLTKLAEGASTYETALLFVLAIGSGYAYGTFQMMAVYEEQVSKAIERIKNEK